jgi:hypothetical protein
MDSLTEDSFFEVSAAAICVVVSKANKEELASKPVASPSVNTIFDKPLRLVFMTSSIH